MRKIISIYRAKGLWQCSIFTWWRELWWLWGGRTRPVRQSVWHSGPQQRWPGQTTCQQSGSTLPRNQLPPRVPKEKREYGECQTRGGTKHRENNEDRKWIRTCGKVLINLLSNVCERECVCAWCLTKGTALIWIRRWASSRSPYCSW